MTSKLRDLPHSKLFGLVIPVMLAGTVLLLPLEGVPADEQAILAVVVLTIGFFISRCVSLAIAGLFGCFLFWIACGQSFSSAFAGFATNTPWFIMGALAIGIMAENAGIPERLAAAFIKRIGTSYAVLLAGLIVLDFILTFIIPSGAARVVLLCGVAIGIVKALDLDLHSNVARGMILVLGFSATIFDKSILAGAASILARGFIEEATGVAVSWGYWFIAYLPVNIIVMAACWFFALKLFPPEIRHFDSAVKERILAKREEVSVSRGIFIRTSVLIGGAVILWATDSFHGIAPAAVAIGIMLIAFLPAPIGVLGNDDFKKINFNIVVFLGCALSLGSVLVHTSILERLTTFLFSWLIPVIGQSHVLSIGLYGMAFVSHIILGSETSLLSATMPLVMNFATTNALNPVVIGMLWTFASGGKLFVYQSPVVALAFSFGSFTTKDLFKLGLAISVVEALCVFLIVPFYWTEVLGVSFFV